MPRIVTSSPARTFGTAAKGFGGSSGSWACGSNPCHGYLACGPPWSVRGEQVGIACISEPESDVAAPSNVTDWMSMAAPSLRPGCASP